MIPINGFNDLNKYDILIITGGEPLLKPLKVRGFIDAFKKIKPKGIIYLYTSIYTIDLNDFLPDIDGMTFTLHSDAKNSDFYEFKCIQTALINCSKKISTRLSVSPDITRPIDFIPNLWNEIKMKNWRNKKDCIIPSNEDLYILKE